ncbi:MAG: Fur family transcriptional regulator, ferric uptake regulator [Actinomycetota bacterium]|jgi:Fur family ferric uptake transcriptional regulator|nr:Fur family transcriptional regulator, ferric uptake regulator [Actinomycetota bacterium]
MTSEPSTTDPAALTSLHSTLRARGYRTTAQRQLVLDAVTVLRHGTPDDICAEVQRTSPAVNISTVYRTLELLEDVGLVTHTHLGHGAPTYHAATDEDHLHLVCRDCGGVTETDVSVADALVQRLASEHGFVTDVAHFAIYGRCPGCTAGPPSGGGAS